MSVWPLDKAKGDVTVGCQPKHANPNAEPPPPSWGNFVAPCALATLRSGGVYAAGGGGGLLVGALSSILVGGSRSQPRVTRGSKSPGGGKCREM